MRRPSHSPSISMNHRQRVLALVGLLVAGNGVGCNKAGIETTSPRTLASDLLKDRTSDKPPVKSVFCPEINQDETVRKTEADVDAYFDRLYRYNAANSIEQPSIKMVKTDHPLLEVDKIKKYCGDISDEMTVSSSDISSQTGPDAIEITHSDMEKATVPVYKLNCEVSYNGEKAAGLFVRSDPSYILIKESVSEEWDQAENRIESIAQHEAIHYYNKIKWELSGGNAYHRADSLFNEEELEILGIEGCDQINYATLNEMAADGYQMMNSSYENALSEWGNSSIHTDDKYRITFQILTKAYFISLKKPEYLHEEGAEEGENEPKLTSVDLFNLVSELSKNNPSLTEFRIRAVGRFMYIAAQKGMKRMKAIEDDNRHRLARK